MTGYPMAPDGQPLGPSREPATPQLTGHPPPTGRTEGQQVLLAAIMGAGGGLLCYILAAPVGRAIALGLVGAVGSYFLLRYLPRVQTKLPAGPPPTVPHRTGAPRWQLDGYQRLFGRRAYLTEATRSRLQPLVERQLRARGLAFHDPNARILLGEQGWQLLDSRPPRPPPARQVVELVESIDRLV